MCMRGVYTTCGWLQACVCVSAVCDPEIKRMFNLVHRASSAGKSLHACMRVGDIRALQGSFVSVYVYAVFICVCKGERWESGDGRY